LYFLLQKQLAGLSKEPAVVLAPIPSIQEVKDKIGGLRSSFIFMNLT
jgi:hypothetical protein